MKPVLSHLLGRAVSALGLLALAASTSADAGSQCGFGSKPDVSVGSTKLTMVSNATGASGSFCTSWSPDNSDITSMTQTFTLNSYTYVNGGPQSGVRRIYGTSAKKVSTLPASGKKISASVTKSGDVRRGVDLFLTDSAGNWEYDIIINYGQQGFTATHGTNQTVPGLPGTWKIKIDTNAQGVRRIAFSPWDVSNRTSLTVDYSQLLRWMLNTTKWITDENSYMRRIGVSSEVVHTNLPNTGNATWTNIRIDAY